LGYVPSITHNHLTNTPITVFVSCEAAPS
jgi:hypothetical protein